MNTPLVPNNGKDGMVIGASVSAMCCFAMTLLKANIVSNHRFSPVCNAWGRARDAPQLHVLFNGQQVLPSQVERCSWSRFEHETAKLGVESRHRFRLPINVNISIR